MKWPEPAPVPTAERWATIERLRECLDPREIERCRQAVLLERVNRDVSALQDWRHDLRARVALDELLYRMAGGHRRHRPKARAATP